MERWRLFITVWYESPTMEDVCRRLSLDRRAASNMAANLRRFGVPLPHKRGPVKAPVRNRPLDWPALRTWASICQGRALAERYRRGVA